MCYAACSQVRREDWVRTRRLTRPGRLVQNKSVEITCWRAAEMLGIRTLDYRAVRAVSFVFPDAR
jgi:hypothetical protein